MRTTQYTLGREAVYRHTHQRLKASLKFRDYGRTCPIDLLLSLLMLAAGRLSSLYQACSLVVWSCCYETARKALESNLPDLKELEARLNEALVFQLPQALRRRRQHLAIDLVLTPYHGQPQHEPNEIYRGRSKSGTTHFHAYATVYVVRRGQRFTVALTYVKAGESTTDILKRLLRRASRVGVKPKLVLLDRGFWSVDVIRYLQAARYPFLMPAIGRGRKADHRKGPSGTNVFFAWTRSGFSRYTLASKTGRKATVSICVKRLASRERQPGEGRTLVYASWGIRLRSTEWVRQTYRRRYGIESSYRQMNQSRARTTSRDPRVRLLRVGVSLILRNVWVWLHYELLSTPRRGGRQFNEHRMYYQQFLGWLLTVILDQLQVIPEIPTERPQTKLFMTHSTVP